MLTILFEPLYTVEEVAQRLNISIRTVRRRIEDKTLPVVRFGRLVRIRPEVLAALISDTRTGDARKGQVDVK